MMHLVLQPMQAVRLGEVFALLPLPLLQWAQKRRMRIVPAVQLQMPRLGEPRASLPWIWLGAVTASTAPRLLRQHQPLWLRNP